MGICALWSMDGQPKLQYRNPPAYHRYVKQEQINSNACFDRQKSANGYMKCVNSSFNITQQKGPYIELLYLQEIFLLFVTKT